jgi:hypothetical protein
LEALQLKAIQVAQLDMEIMVAQEKTMALTHYALAVAVVQAQLVKMRQTQQRQEQVVMD